MRLKLFELQNNNIKIKNIRVEGLSKDQKDIKKVFYYQDLLYILKIIFFKLINKYHNDLLMDHFKIKKTQELII